ncbi:MAG: hypothetical protein OWQ51_01810 [Pyrobaculum arsenaticum]|nr:hypothetical protein [Pyrobaculum arsenaticum]MCY0889712.1 hypothetical protein [Pyrobaculum arsenaticum]
MSVYIEGNAEDVFLPIMDTPTVVVLEEAPGRRLQGVLPRRLAYR